MLEILREEWLWIIILSVIAILVFPLILIWLVLYLPPELRLVITIVLIIGWGIAAGCKDWLTEKRKEEKKKTDF